MIRQLTLRRNRDQANVAMICTGLVGNVLPDADAMMGLAVRCRTKSLEPRTPCLRSQEVAEIHGLYGHLRCRVCQDGLGAFTPTHGAV